MFFITAAWAWALPYVGPLLPSILRNIPALDTFKRWARRGFVALLVIAALACAYVLLKSLRNPFQEYVSAAEVNASLYAERNRQLIKSVGELQHALDTRELEAAAAALELEKLRKEMEETRAKSPDPNAVVFPADDPWLQSKRRR